MIAEYVQDDDSIDYTPPADVAAGDVVVVGKLIAVATRPIKSGELGALAVEGVFSFPKSTAVGSAIPRGSNVYWDAANTQVTTSPVGGTNVLIGKTILDAADTDDKVRALLIPAHLLALRAGAAQAALNAYADGAHGLAAAVDMQALVAMVVEIRATLVALGIWKGSA